MNGIMNKILKEIKQWISMKSDPKKKITVCHLKIQTSWTDQ